MKSGMLSSTVEFGLSIQTHFGPILMTSGSILVFITTPQKILIVFDIFAV